MLRNWFIVAIRGLVRHRLYAAINILGLAIGLAAAMLILVFVRQQFSYDGFFSNADRVYRVYARDLVQGGRAGTMTQPPLAPLLAASLPEVETAVRLVNSREVAVRDEGSLYVNLSAADPGFLTLFDFAFSKGDPADALAQPNTVVLTPEAARRLFGDADPMGRTVSLANGVELRVTGLLSEPPTNTHLRIEMLTSFETPLPITRKWTEWPEQRAWENSYLSTYVLLRPGTDAAAVEARLPALLEERVPGYGEEEELGRPFSIHLQPLKHIHTRPVDETGGVSPALLAAFIGIAVMMLALAGINFVNLSTARASLRAKEVALRKALGAGRGALMAQFIGESVLLALMGGVAAVAIVENTMPLFLREIGLRMGPEFYSLGVLAWMGLGLSLLVGVLGGLYPALVLSRFAPARVLRGTGGGAGRGRLRTALVVGQFAIAILFIVATLVTLAQTRHARNARLGFDKENVILLRGLDRPQVAAQREVLRQRLAADPDVVAVSAAFAVPGDFSTATSSFDWDGRRISLRVESVDGDYARALGIPVLAGRVQERGRAQDLFGKAVAEGMQGEVGVTISRAAISHLGFESPEQAVGQAFPYAFGEGRVTARIVGVLEDVQYSTVRRPIMPTLFLMRDEELGTTIVRIRPDSMPAVAERVDAIWADLFPDTPISRQFLDDRIDALYTAESKQGLFLSIFAGLAVLVACLGLFGLAAFTAERRTKEIGIRKVLGARTRDIVRLLVWQFSKPVVLANLIAWPLAWFIMSKWLEGYAYRIDMDPLFFLAAGAGALVIAWATVAGHAARVARRRPVTALRYE